MRNNWLISLSIAGALLTAACTSGSPGVPTTTSGGSNPTAAVTTTAGTPTTASSTEAPSPTELTTTTATTPTVATTPNAAATSAVGTPTAIATTSALTPTSAATSTALTPSPAAATSGSAATFQVATNPTLGKILTNAQGMALYVYASDKNGTSTCIDTCATTWPPVVATSIPPAPAGDTGTFTLITRPDGIEQLAYNGQPLYTYSKDTKPGDVTGQGVGGAWRVAQPGSSTGSGG